MEYREIAHQQGIVNWRRVPALNTAPDFIEDVAQMVIDALDAPALSIAEAASKSYSDTLSLSAATGSGSATSGPVSSVSMLSPTALSGDLFNRPSLDVRSPEEETKKRKTRVVKSKKDDDDHNNNGHSDGHSSGHKSHNTGSISASPSTSSSIIADPDELSVSTQSIRGPQDLLASFGLLGAAGTYKCEVCHTRFEFLCIIVLSV